MQMTIRPALSTLLVLGCAIVAVADTYTQQAATNYEGRVAAITKYWQHAPANESEGTWTAPLPLFSTDRQLWAYADIAYALDREVFSSGGGRVLSSDRFNVSSHVRMVSADQLKSAGVKASTEPGLLIEDFQRDWEKEWFVKGARSRKTFKLRSPQFQAPPNSRLGIEVQSENKGRMLLRFRAKISWTNTKLEIRNKFKSPKSK